jgi:hypothetical protein
MRSDTTRRTTTAKHARTLGSVLAAGALLAAPASGLAAKHTGKGKAAKANACKTVKAPFNVSGTFVSADATAGTITMTVTGANRHARNSGEIADQNAAKKGVQVKGATYTVAAATDAFALKLDGYEAPDTPSAGDRVHVRGKVALTRKRCAPATMSTADRHGAVDIRRVTVSDRDADA